MPIKVDEPEIRKKIKELAKSAIFPPEGIEGDEVWEHRWFCRGGISSLMWVLGESSENTKHEIEYIDEEKCEL